MAKGTTQHGTPFPFNDDADFVKGRFSLADARILTVAIDEYIKQNFTCDRVTALKLLTAKHGRQPSILTSISQRLLPGRDPKSIYNFVRRRLVPYRTGYWTKQELYYMLQTYFENNLAETKTYNKWKELAILLNRSPEQIYDKFKKIKPSLSEYRQIIENRNLSEKEKIDLLGGNAKGESCISKATSKRIYSTIKHIISKHKVADPVIQNIPWEMVHAKHPNISKRTLRNHFNLVLIPKIYSQLYPGFGREFAARIAIGWIRKCRRDAKELQKSLDNHGTDDASHNNQTPSVASSQQTGNESDTNSKNDTITRDLAKYDFTVPFSQVPRAYILRCTRRFLTQCYRDADKPFRKFSTLVKHASKALQVKRFAASDQELLAKIPTATLPEYRP